MANFNCGSASSFESLKSAVALRIAILGGTVGGGFVGAGPGVTAGSGATGTSLGASSSLVWACAT
jgi:hypothetical protein